MCQVFWLSIATYQTVPELRGLKSPFSYILHFCRSRPWAGLSLTILSSLSCGINCRYSGDSAGGWACLEGPRWLDSGVWHLGGNGTRLGVAETADCIVA